MSSPSVTLRQGTFLGAELKRNLPKVLEQFLGVPYGLSTAGERRFRPPLPVIPSNRTFKATSFGQRCPSGMPSGPPMGEDCLNANIYRPKERDSSKKLPVVIHFHGGSFNFGCGPDRNIPSLVAWSTEPILGVTFNYRLGAFGFLPIEGALNIGLKDQALLLQWVHENIAEFGGDPDNVTLMGVSAGAHSIGHHIMHQKSPHLFHKAIIESGATTARAVYPHTNLLHVNQLRTFARNVGLASVSPSDLLTALRSLPESEISRASEMTFAAYDAAVLWPFQPVIDGPGGVIPIAPIKAWESGDWARIPILTGFNTNEGAAFVPVLMSSSAEFTHFFRTLLPGLSEEDLKELNAVYPDPDTDPTSKYKETRPKLGSQFFRLEQAYGQFAYVAPVRQTASFASKQPDSSVYLYHFAVICSRDGGANHGDHCDFATYSEGVPGGNIEAVSRAMHDYWTSFIITSNPNLVAGRYEDRPIWPVYEAGKHAKKVVFGKGNDVLAGGGNEGETVVIENDTWAEKECQFWWERTELFER